ncbi:MAG: SpoIID/LytB domain-containing protein, partial [Acidimicrobiia bacterium]|nr:SpoIID/LytB domain-containing protein [Acidimicrobiia bacterium]
MRIVVAVLLSLMAAAPAAAQESAAFGEVEFVPAEGTTLTFGERSYAGTLRMSVAPDGLVLVEDVGIDGYLSGIREVPLSWHEEALAAQVVAARTYLAWTLDRGRSADGVKYGYDICATTSCQVYAGVGVVRGPDGDRWAEAIERTTGEVLLYEGKPAQAMYHSTSGGRTEPIEDIFDSTPKPYLVGAESPGEQSPFVDWSYEIPA